MKLLKWTPGISQLKYRNQLKDYLRKKLMDKLNRVLHPMFKTTNLELKFESDRLKDWPTSNR